MFIPWMFIPWMFIPENESEAQSKSGEIRKGTIQRFCFGFTTSSPPTRPSMLRDRRNP
jgi:hypothetical protein